MSSKLVIALAALVASCIAQRSPYAGRRPIGYPEFVAITTTTTTPNANDLGNRFADERDVTTTTQRLPIEALGDRALVERLSRLPVDKQPFWFINWQALENLRKNPQTYPQRGSSFIDTASNGFRS